MKTYKGLDGTIHSLPDYADTKEIARRLREAEADLLASISDAAMIWDRLGSIPVDDYGLILEPFYMRLPDGRMTGYDVLTDREDIWHDIEDSFPVCVGWMMGGSE